MSTTPQLSAHDAVTLKEDFWIGDRLVAKAGETIDRDLLDQKMLDALNAVAQAMGLPKIRPAPPGRQITLPEK